MKSYKKFQVKIIGNDELSKEEERAIWAKFFDLMNKKKLQKESSVVGQEDQKLQGRKIIN